MENRNMNTVTKDDVIKSLEASRDLYRTQEQKALKSIEFGAGPDVAWGYTEAVRAYEKSIRLIKLIGL